MKKLKKFYKEHRIFTILMSIVIVCLILITTILVQCFYVGNGSNKYGDRLDGIDKVEISTSRQSDYEVNITNNQKVKSTDLQITGRIIYITIQFEEKVDLVEAESIAQKSLEAFSDEEKAFYDFNFTLKENSSANTEGFIISGAKNKNSSKIVWNNNRDASQTQTKDDGSTEKEA
jgi:hypothetical protein